MDFTATGRYLQVQVTLNREIIDCEPAGEALLCDLMICKDAECTVNTRIREARDAAGM